MHRFKVFRYGLNAFIQPIQDDDDDDDSSTDEESALNDPESSYVFEINATTCALQMTPNVVLLPEEVRQGFKKGIAYAIVDGWEVVIFEDDGG